MSRLDYLLGHAHISAAAWEAGVAFRRDWRLALQAIGAASNPGHASPECERAAIRLHDTVNAIGYLPAWLISEAVVYNHSFEETGRVIGRDRIVAMGRIARALRDLSNAGEAGHRNH